jgi:hypothetical protein
MDGSKYVSLIERTRGSSLDPGEGWSVEEVAWQMKRAEQLGGEYKWPDKRDVLKFSRSYIRETLLRPILDVLDDEEAALVRDLPIGLVNNRTLS